MLWYNAFNYISGLTYARPISHVGVGKIMGGETRVYRDGLVFSVPRKGCVCLRDGAM